MKTDTLSPAAAQNQSAASPHSQMRIILGKLAIDLLAFVPWLSIALLSRSVLLLTDMFEFGRSITVGIISWQILRRIIRGKTAEFDYGHGKIEVLGSVLVSGAMLAGLLVMIFVSFERLLNPQRINIDFAAGGILLCMGGVIVNGWLWRRNRIVAEQSRAPLMEAQWRINRADTYANLSAVIGLGCSIGFATQIWSVYADPVFALGLNIYAGISIVRLIRRSLDDLLDKTLDEKLQLKILKGLAEIDSEYDYLYDIRSRKSGSRSFIDIGIGFSPEKSVGQALHAADQLRTSIESDIPGSEISIILKPERTLRSGMRISGKISVERISSTTLQQTRELFRPHFYDYDVEPIRKELEESIYPGRYTLELQAKGICSPKYWVALQNGDVLAAVGYRFNPADCAEALWGGWMAAKDLDSVHSALAASMVLMAAAESGIKTGRKYFRFETEEKFYRANLLYKHLGLEVYAEKINPDGSIFIYRQAELSMLFEKFSQRIQKLRQRAN